MATRPEDYTVAWICAITIEHAVACGMLDEVFPKDKAPLINTTVDDNSYTFGRIHGHNVVIASLPLGRYGTTSAAIVATHMQFSFPALQIRLMVGIAGGAPSEKHDIRLGDIIVSSPTSKYGGVLQYDFGKTVQKQAFEITSHMSPPPQRLLNAIADLASRHKANGNKIGATVDEMLKRIPNLKAECSRPAPGEDRLYSSSYVHANQGSCDCHDPIDHETEGNRWYHQILVPRRPRSQHDQDPDIHHGLIASANSLMKDAMVRDALTKEYDVLCFEMEAAGLMNSFSCLIIRGICDYSDTHKNKVWQGYAAAAAAAYAKELLEIIPARNNVFLQDTHSISLLESNKVTRDDSSLFTIPFSLEGVPLPKKFISRPTEMKLLEDSLLQATDSRSGSERQQIFVLRGLGGIGKTQLAVEFMRLHKSDFSAIFWLDGSSQDNLKRDIASHLKRTQQIQISTTGNMHAELSNGDTDTAVREFLAWLAKPLNSKWLLIFDNIDRDFDPFNPAKSIERDPLAYDVTNFLPKADHGSILITTRLTRLERLGESNEVRKVDGSIANNILKSWYKRATYNESEICRLLDHLDGLPLAIAQAGAYLQETRMSIEDYLQLYDQQQGKVTRFISEENNALLNDYSGRSLWTTWMISYEAIQAQDKHSANMLVLWSFLDRNGFCFGLIQDLSEWSYISQASQELLGDIASDRVSFANTMRLLRSYSLIEGSDDDDTYSMHTVVHRWIYSYQGLPHRSDVGSLAFAIVSLSLPKYAERDYVQLLQRISPHVQACRDKFLSIEQSDIDQDWINDFFSNLLTVEQREEVTAACWNGLGGFDFHKGKFTEAQQIWERALRCYEKNRGTQDTQTLSVVYNLGLIHRLQSRYVEAEQMYMRTLEGRKQALGDEEVSTLDVLHNLGIVYREQNKLPEAEQMFMQALQGKEKALGLEHTSTLDTANSLGILYRCQGRLDEAEQMILRALRGEEQALGIEHPYVSETVNNLASLYEEQGKLDEAERLCMRALGDLEQASRLAHRSKGHVALRLGNVLIEQNRLVDAEQALQRGLWELQQTPNTMHDDTLEAISAMGRVYELQDKQDEAAEIYTRLLQGYEQAPGPKRSWLLKYANRLGLYYKKQGRYAEAQETFKKGLEDYETLLGVEATKTRISAVYLMQNLGSLYWQSDHLPEAKIMYDKALAGWQETKETLDEDDEQALQNLKRYLKEYEVDDEQEGDDKHKVDDKQEMDDTNSSITLVESSTPKQEKKAGKIKTLLHRFKKQ